MPHLIDHEYPTEPAQDLYQFQVFEYPLRQRLPMLVLSAIAVPIVLLIEIVVLLSLIRTVTGWEILSGTGPGDVGTFVAAIVVPMFLIFGNVMVHLMFPAIHVRSDGFRIRRLFYTSPWLGWNNIRAVRTHWLTDWLPSKRRRIVGVSVGGVSQIYDVIGAFQQFDAKTFIVHDGLNDYDELMSTLQRHRPELFEAGE